MADLVLHDSLVDEYLKFKDNSSFNKSKIQKLFKYILPFSLKDNHPLMQDPAIKMQLEGSDPLIEISNEVDMAVLVQNSSLKLMLIDRNITPTPTFTTVNIMGIIPEKLQPKYGATYPNAIDKTKAKAHIKALLSDASWVTITDSYIANQDWNQNKTLINELVPHKAMDLTIIGSNGSIGSFSITELQKQEIKSLYNNWIVKCRALNIRIIHDRYIETNKLKILLSSGLYHLSESSQKDFTYIIELK